VALFPRQLVITEPGTRASLVGLFLFRPGIPWTGPDKPWTAPDWHVCQPGPYGMSCGSAATCLTLNVLVITVTHSVC